MLKQDRGAIQPKLVAPDGQARRPMEISDDILTMGFAAVHNTSFIALNCLYELLDRPEVVRELTDEAESVRATHCQGRQWTKEGLSQLEKLDSFMAECLRYNPPFFSKSR